MHTRTRVCAAVGVGMCLLAAGCQSSQRLPSEAERLVDELRRAGPFERQRIRQDLRALGPEAVAPLFYALNDPESKLADEAAHALSMFGEDAIDEFVVALNPSIFEILDPTRAPNDEGKAELRERAARALGRIGQAAIPPLIEALDRQDDAAEGAKLAFRYIGAPAVPALTAMASDEGRSDQAREAAREVLAELARAAAPADTE